MAISGGRTVSSSELYTLPYRLATVSLPKTWSTYTAAKTKNHLSRGGRGWEKMNKTDLPDNILKKK